MIDDGLQEWRRKQLRSRPARSKPPRPALTFRFGASDLVSNQICGHHPCRRIALQVCGSHLCWSCAQAFQLQQQRQLAALAAASAAASTAADATGGPAPPPTERSDLPSAQSSGLSSPEGSAFPHVASGGITLQPAGRSGADVPTFKNWLAAHSAQSTHSSITSVVSVAPPAPATPPAADAPPRAVLVDGGDSSLPIPIMVPMPHGPIPGAEFWRNSLQDPVVSGFNGASLFGAIGKSPT